MRWRPHSSKACAIAHSCLGAVLLCNVNIATAQNIPPNAITVSDMLSHCEESLSGEQHAIHGYCMGNIMGIGAMMTINCVQSIDGLPRHLKMSSLPATNAGVQAFVNWARNNPAQWGDLFIVGIMRALSETWPCETP